MRTFETGATRDTDEGKLDFEAFFSPLVLERYAEYMHLCRTQSDGNLRAGDNWQNGMPKKVYMKSGWRHFFRWWCCHRGLKQGIQTAICALIFNAMGYLYELLKEETPQAPPKTLRPTGGTPPLKIETMPFKEPE